MSGREIEEETGGWGSCMITSRVITREDMTGWADERGAAKLEPRTNSRLAKSSSLIVGGSNSWLSMNSHPKDG